MRYLKKFSLFEKAEVESTINFIKKNSKKDAKTETYDVVKSGEVIGQIRWYSRIRGYAFLPEKEHNEEINSFIKDLMNKRKKTK